MAQLNVFIYQSRNITLQNLKVCREKLEFLILLKKSYTVNSIHTISETFTILKKL